MIDTSLIIKIITFSIIAIVLAKVFAPFFGAALWGLLFGTKKKKNSDLDFDALISQKKTILRGGLAGASDQVLTSASSSKGGTEEAIQNEYKELSQKSDKSPNEVKRFAELKEIIKIIDSLQWGNIAEVEKLEKKLSQSYSHRFSASGNFSFLLTRGAFLDSHGKWLGIDKTFLVVENYTFLKELIQANDLRALIAKRWQMEVVNLDKSLSFLINNKKGKKYTAALVKTAQAVIPSPKDHEILALLIITPGVLKNKSTLLNEIRKEAEVFHALSPLPVLKNDKDLEGAFKSLGLSSQANLEQIKNRYKKLAQLKHPDTLKAKGIPAEFETIATENFTQIKRAYDILVREINNS